MAAVWRADDVTSGEPYIEDADQQHYDECCDCGLVHRIKYEVLDAEGKVLKGTRLRITTWTHKYYTRQARYRRLRKGHGFGHYAPSKP